MTKYSNRTVTVILRFRYIKVLLYFSSLCCTNLVYLIQYTVCILQLERLYSDEIPSNKELQSVDGKLKKVIFVNVVSLFPFLCLCSIYLNETMRFIMTLSIQLHNDTVHTHLDIVNILTPVNRSSNSTVTFCVQNSSLGKLLV